MPNQQNAAPRSTEGPRQGQKAPASRLRQKRPGRPKGSKNKPKGLLPAIVSNALVERMKSTLSPDQFEYFEQVIKGTGQLDTKKELDILMVLLNRNLIPHLVAEMGGCATPEDCEHSESDHRPTVSMDVTQRIRAVKDLLTLRNQIERREEDPHDGQEPLLTIYASRSIDPSRLASLVSPQPGTISGDADGAGRPADSAGAAANPFSERPIALPSGLEEPADRVLDGDRRRGSGDGDLEGELQG